MMQPAVGPWRRQAVVSARQADHEQDHVDGGAPPEVAMPHDPQGHQGVARGDHEQRPGCGGERAHAQHANAGDGKPRIATPYKMTGMKSLPSISGFTHPRIGSTVCARP